MINILKFFLIVLFLQLNLFASDSLQKIKLQLQWKHQFEFAGFYAAKEKGYYKDAGIDVEFLEYDEKKSIINSVLNKEADFGLTYSSLIAEYLKGKDVVFVANYFKQSPLVIVAQEDIKTPVMLKGKKVMGVSDNIDNITLRLMLEKFNISLDEIKHIPTSYSVDQFVQKKVDAMALFTTNEIYELDKLGVKYNIFNPSLYGQEYYDVNLFTSKEFASNNPALVQKFKLATNRGWKYALNHKEEIVKLIQKKYNTQHKTKEALLFEAQQIQQLMFIKTHNIGDIDFLRVQFIAKNFIESGYVDSSRLAKLDSFIFNYSNTKKTILQLTTDEQKWLDKNKIIKIASLSSWPKNEKGQNIHTEYLNLLRKYGDINIFNVEFESWSEAYESVVNNHFVNGILYLSWSKQRSEKYFNYLPPYSFVPTNLVVKKNNNTIKSLKDLNNSSVYTLKKSISNIIIKESGLNIKTIPLESEKELVKALASPNPKAKAILTFNYTPNRFKNNDLKIVKRIQNRYGNVHIGVSKEQTIAYSILKKAHNNIPKDELVKLQNHRFINVFNKFIEQLDIDEKAYLSKKINITMCVDPDWEPYEKIDKSGNHIGLASDYIKLIEKKIDKKIKLIKTKSWQETLAFAKDGKCEIISFLNQTQSRDKYLNFTSNLYSEPEVIVAKDNVTYLDGISALDGKTVGLVKGNRSDEYISKNYPNVKIKYIKNYEEGIRLVSSNKLDATVNSLLGTAYLIRKLNLVDVKIAGKTELINSYKIGVIKDEPLLHSILTKAVSDITQQEKDKIFSNWVSVKFEQGYDYDILWRIFWISLVILLLLLYRQYTIKKLNEDLKKQVKKQVAQIVEKDRMIFQQNKLASMGEMIENIAHQWRQPLSQVNAAVMIIDDIAYDCGCLKKEMKKELDDIEKATKYMSKTIDDFRGFVSQNNSQELFSISDVVHQCLNLVSKYLEYNSIEVQVDIKQSLKVKGSSSEFLQVLMIVINNAKDAIISNEITKGKIVVKGYENNKSIFLSINDNAGGVNEDIIEKIFEPYFTTKHKSQGTGLGLYISKMIIESKFSGKLWMENRNNGACIVIELNR